MFVTTNERAFIVAALESLESSPPQRDVEIVVVDNASSDGAGDEITRRWPQVRVLAQKTRQRLPVNLNTGLAATGAHYAMVCNSDVVFRPGAVDALATFLDDHPEVAMVAPRLLSPEGRTWPSGRRWYTWRALLALRCPGIADPKRFPSVRRSLYADWDHVSPRCVDWVHCPATMIRRAALDEVGVMDERFRIYFGDVDLALRMHEAGWQVWCEPAAEVAHVWQRASVRFLSGAWFSHLGSLLQFWHKYYGLRPRTKGPVEHVAARSK